MRNRTAAALLGVVSTAIGLGGAVVAGSAAPAAGQSERVIKVAAKFFAFTPSEIVLKKGQPVVFELTTVDFGHGFRIPDLDFRADFVPGKVTLVRITPGKSGKFDFLCDNFCGNGHEEMNGHLVVED